MYVHTDTCLLIYILPRRYSTGEPRLWSAHNNEADCVEAGGNWFTEYGYIDVATNVRNNVACISLNSTLTRGYTSVWAPRNWADRTPQCLILPPPPDCQQVGWSRVNHLGNGRDGVPLNYTWKIPYFMNNKTKLAVVRIR